jgi:hypothetical protein
MKGLIEILHKMKYLNVLKFKKNNKACGDDCIIITEDYREWAFINSIVFCLYT